MTIYFLVPPFFIMPGFIVLPYMALGLTIIPRLPFINGPFPEGLGGRGEFPLTGLFIIVVDFFD